MNASDAGSLYSNPLAMVGNGCRSQRCGVLPAPERGPRRRRLWQSRTRRCGCPTVEGDVLRTFEHVGLIEVFVNPAREIPIAVDLLVLVVIPDRGDYPPVSDFVLSSAIHSPSGPLSAEQLDTVTNDVMYGPVEQSQLRRDHPAKSVSTPAMPTEVNVRNEQPKPRVHIAIVDSQRVPYRQLLDLESVLDASDAVCKIFAGFTYCHWGDQKTNRRIISASSRLGRPCARGRKSLAPNCSPTMATASSMQEMTFTCRQPSVRVSDIYITVYSIAWPLTRARQPLVGAPAIGVRGRCTGSTAEGGHGRRSSHWTGRPTRRLCVGSPKTALIR